MEDFTEKGGYKIRQTKVQIKEGDTKPLWKVLMNAKMATEQPWVKKTLELSEMMNDQGEKVQMLVRVHIHSWKIIKINLDKDARTFDWTRIAGSNMRWTCDTPKAETATNRICKSLNVLDYVILVTQMRRRILRVEVLLVNSLAVEAL